jgi:hypothetical protein
MMFGHAITNNISRLFFNLILHTVYSFLNRESFKKTIRGSVISDDFLSQQGDGSVVFIHFIVHAGYDHMVGVYILLAVQSFVYAVPTHFDVVALE